MTEVLPDEQRGLYGKYFVARQDGTDTGPCFVLAPARDPYAVVALEAYAKACRATHGPLADDLEDWVREIRDCVCRDDGDHPPCPYHVDPDRDE